MAGNIKTCLWFDGNGLEAARFYTGLIPNSRIISDVQTEQPLTVEFELDGVPYQVLNGGPQFKFNEAVSIVLYTDDQAETDKYWYALIADGGEESQCGWLKDKFGLSWQIVPRALFHYLGNPDRAGAERAMQAMLKMRRLVIAQLDDAFHNR